MMTVENWISTQKVPKLDFLNPHPEDIHITDIANALSKLCRFGGHCNEFYSVAEHSIILAEILEDRGANKATLLAALLHDASEAYLGDMPRPIKAQCDNYIFMHVAMEECIHVEKYNLDEFCDDTYNDKDAIDWIAIKDMDGRLCITEAKQLGLYNSNWDNRGEPLNFNLHLWTHQEAYQLFLMNFAEIVDSLSITITV